MTSISHTLNQLRKKILTATEDKACFEVAFVNLQLTLTFLLCHSSLKHSQSNSRSYQPRIYCPHCNFLPQELERLPFILKDHTLLH